MSINKLIVPGFGTGSAYGTPTTIGLASSATVTLTGTVLPAGQYFMTGLTTNCNFNLISTTNSVTGTFAILSGAPGHVVYDGQSGTLSSTFSVSVSVVAISF